MTQCWYICINIIVGSHKLKGTRENSTYSNASWYFLRQSTYLSYITRSLDNWSSALTQQPHSLLSGFSTFSIFSLRDVIWFLWCFPETRTDNVSLRSHDVHLPYDREEAAGVSGAGEVHRVHAYHDAYAHDADRGDVATDRRKILVRVHAKFNFER